MSSTYSAYDAYLYAQKFLSGQDLDRFVPRILDDVHRMFWMYAPWRWTLGLFPTFNLAGSTQDYVVTLPSDFLFLQEARILDGKNSIHVHCGALFPSLVGLQSGQPSQASIQTVNNNTVVRISPAPGQFPTGAPAQVFTALYKKSAPKMDATTCKTSGGLLIPDEYFWVYQEGVLWRAMYWAQDPRAGDAQVQGDKIAFTGQRAAFEAAMQQLAETEKLNRVDEQEEQR